MTLHEIQSDCALTGDGQFLSEPETPARFSSMKEITSEWKEEVSKRIGLTLNQVHEACSHHFRLGLTLASDLHTGGEEVKTTHLHGECHHIDD